MSFELATFRPQVAALAKRGIYLGTSSWKYPGWCGQLYTAARYEYRSKFAKTRFEDNCLQEYAETFSTVCVDGAYYTFPSEEHLQRQAAQVPGEFRFAYKVTDAITIRRFPILPKYKDRGGMLNEEFLNAELFVTRFLKPLVSIRPKVGPIMFEFSKFHPADYGHGRDFVADLNRFFLQLPTGWNFGVELRNREWLVPDYFDCLRRHNVTHVFNNWTDMPRVGEQIALLEGPVGNSAVARFLLTPGRKYQQAVEAFLPYAETREVDEQARRDGADLIRWGLRYIPGKGIYIYINNRLEGNALLSLQAILALAKMYLPAEASQPPTEKQLELAPSVPPTLTQPERGAKKELQLDLGLN